MSAELIYEVGDVMQYEDMANPARLYLIVEVRPENAPWTPYVLAPLGDHEGTATDLRQRGWTKVDVRLRRRPANPS